MPCDSGPDDDCGRCCDCESNKQEVDKLTRYLCAVLTKVEAVEGGEVSLGKRIQKENGTSDAELKMWWNKHKRIDQDRIKRENEYLEQQIFEKALDRMKSGSKLTVKEKALKALIKKNLQ
tara:strand:+ start:71639 stop:71998 length:360 start_codon:yes stop_codon:yes gene_type:complete